MNRTVANRARRQAGAGGLVAEHSHPSPKVRHTLPLLAALALPVEREPREKPRPWIIERFVKPQTIIPLTFALLLMLPAISSAVDLIMRVGTQECVATFAPGSQVETYPDRWEAQVAELPDCPRDIIDPPPDDGPCQILPNGLTRDVSVRYTLGNDFTARFGVTYEEIFGTWPLSEEALGRTYRIEVSSSRYLSIPFTVPETGGPSDRAIFQWEEGLAPSDGTVVSVSTCEGGVVESQALPGCWERGSRSGGGLTFGVDAATAECVLERGRSYWLNVADYDEETGESTCDRAVCEWLVRPIAVGAVE